MRRCSISMMSATSARDCGTSRRGVDTVVEFKDGTKVTLPGNDVEHMRQMSQPIVPAAPGLYEVRFFFWDETPSAAAVLAFPGLREPVLAWRCREIWPEAIVIDTHEPASDDGGSAILYRLALSTSPAVRNLGHDRYC
jgi:hypothetical protein